VLAGVRGADSHAPPPPASTRPNVLIRRIASRDAVIIGGEFTVAPELIAITFQQS
jgi:hypothetical protein